MVLFCFSMGRALKRRNIKIYDGYRVYTRYVK